MLLAPKRSLTKNKLKSTGPFWPLEDRTTPEDMEIVLHNEKHKLQMTLRDFSSHYRCVLRELESIEETWPNRIVIKQFWKPNGVTWFEPVDVLEMPSAKNNIDQGEAS